MVDTPLPSSRTRARAVFVDEPHEQEQEVGGRCEASSRAERVGQREHVDEPAQRLDLGELLTVAGHASLRQACDERSRPPALTTLMGTSTPAHVPFEPCQCPCVATDDVEHDQADDGSGRGDPRDRWLHQTTSTRASSAATATPAAIRTRRRLSVEWRRRRARRRSVPGRSASGPSTAPLERGDRSGLAIRRCLRAVGTRPGVAWNVVGSYAGGGAPGA